MLTLQHGPANTVRRGELPRDGVGAAGESRGVRVGEWSLAVRRALSTGTVTCTQALAGTVGSHGAVGQLVGVAQGGGRMLAACCLMGIA